MIIHGDCIEEMRKMDECSVDAIVTDPPYGLGFMGKGWDTPNRMIGQSVDSGTGAFHGQPGTHTRGYADNDPRYFQEWCNRWAVECLRVLKPGGHLLAFGGTRTWHRLTVAIEDAGFEMRDSIAWLYGSGFPKSLDVSKAIDKAAGAEREVVGVHHRHGGGSPDSSSMSGPLGTGSELPLTAPATPEAEQWQGWGTSLKPGFEPCVVARKPIAAGTVAANVLQHGTGALNIDGCRIAHGTDVDLTREQRQSSETSLMGGLGNGHKAGHVQPIYAEGGRWPANVALDADQAAALDEQSGPCRSTGLKNVSHVTESDQTVYGARAYSRAIPGVNTYDDKGGASRFFYVAKAPKKERPVVDGVAHPTVKPLALMRWLVRLVTPPGGTVLDPFAGSGTTVEAALLEGFKVIGIEREADYLPLIAARMDRVALAATEPVSEPSLFEDEESA